MNLLHWLKRFLLHILLSYIKIWAIALAIIFSFLTFIEPSTQLSAQPSSDLPAIVNLQDRHESFPLGKYLDFLEDKDNSLTIDDFGTGYSSLSRLHELPIDTLKIDQSFVKRIGSESDSVEIIETIISLTHSLNMSSVAECVETQAQLEKLIEIGCQFGQGYLFSKPCDRDTVYQILQKLQNESLKPI